MFTATPTKLGTWVDCPRRYRLTYLDRAPKGPPWAHNSLGVSVHNALRDWYLLEVAERTADAAADLVRRGWVADGFRDAEQSEQWRERAVRMVVRYVSRLDPAVDPAGVERTVAFRTERLAMSGRADRIDREGDELVVVDYKTGRTPPGPDDARGSLALAVYAVASASTLRAPCRRVELHHLPSGSVARWSHDDASLRRHVARAEDIATDAQEAELARSALLAEAADDADVEPEVDALFPPRPGPACGYCDVVRSCAEGVAAVDGVLPPPWRSLELWPAEL